MGDHSRATPRKPISKRLRFEVFRRDGFRCVYCGAKGSETGAGLHIDHVLPVALGGDDSLDNLAASCPDCNQGKSSTLGDGEIADDLAQRNRDRARAMREAIRGLGGAGLDSREEIARMANEIYDAWVLHGRGWCPELDEIEKHVRKWSNCGYPIDMLADQVFKVPSGCNSYWRYYCGIIWNQIKAARKAIDAETVDQ